MTEEYYVRTDEEFLDLLRFKKVFEKKNLVAGRITMIISKQEFADAGIPLEELRTEENLIEFELKHKGKYYTFGIYQECFISLLKAASIEKDFDILIEKEEY